MTGILLGYAVAHPVGNEEGSVALFGDLDDGAAGGERPIVLFQARPVPAEVPPGERVVAVVTADSDTWTTVATPYDLATGERLAREFEDAAASKHRRPTDNADYERGRAEGFRLAAGWARRYPSAFEGDVYPDDLQALNAELADVMNTVRARQQVNALRIEVRRLRAMLGEQ